MFFLAGLTVLLLVDPAESVWMPKCPVKLLTGLSCPGCGFQRAAHALLQGDVLAALRFNWFFLFAGPYLLVLILESFFLKGEWQQRVRHWAENKYVVWAYIVGFCVWFVLRNILDI